MQLSAILGYKFPGMSDAGGYEIGMEGADPDTGEGGEQAIREWNEEVMGRGEPTQAEIDGWELPATKQARRRAIKRDAENEYDAIFEQDGEHLDMFKDRLLVKLGRQSALTQGETNARDKMTAVQSKMETKLQAIRDADTVEEVEAVTW